MSSNGHSNHIVLLADDDAFMRSIVANIIRSTLGCDVEIAASGRDAIDRLGSPKAPVTLALLDFVMPDGNGLAVARTIRAGFGQVRRDLPIVMMTGRADSGLVRSAMELDINGYVVKPVTKEALFTRMERAWTLPFDLKAPEVYRRVEVPDPWPAERPRSATPVAPPPLPTPPPEPPPSDALSRRTRVETPVANLVPGSILATIVRAHSGEVILPSHIRLDRALIARLSDLADMGMIPPVVFTIASQEG